MNVLIPLVVAMVVDDKGKGAIALRPQSGGDKVGQIPTGCHMPQPSHVTMHRLLRALLLLSRFQHTTCGSIWT